MKRIVDLDTEQEFAELRSIFREASNGGHIVSTLKQVVKRDEGYSYVDLRKRVSKQNCLIQLNDRFFYIIFQNVNAEDIRAIEGMWKTVLQRGTENNTNGKENDYLLVIDIVKSDLEKNKSVSQITALQPVIVSNDGNNSMSIVFDLEYVSCSREEVSMYDIEYEMLNRETYGNVPEFTVDETDVEKETSVAEDFINDSVNKFLDVT